ncbi:VWA domain-containing protein [Deinococcus maricopensis]|uniref:VWA containing CoxE family protein n=1 Tax=Deinococcus maricopensis (strain DSM 21211 / LMG 22137 / NRRL B-23946 / LB-34) TaxID=709986 RepID=E8U5J7_DEIML|nr:VWA domain-containing protein [Deinococcus maricopensis]ADV66336.1 VWA containing CoxE family protein [Deinococcus maricopensis DSM 21211]
MTTGTEERLRRWRLVLGGGSADGTGCALGGQDERIDAALAAVYGDAEGGEVERKDRLNVGRGKSAPKVARWLAEVRELFPQGTVKVMQQDAIERLNLKQLLLEPELMDAVEPDVNLAVTLLSLKDVMPDAAKERARSVVRHVTDELTRRLEEPLRAAVTGTLNRAARTNRPRPRDIDWGRTIRANLGTYQPDRRTIIPERLVGYARARRQMRSVTLCVDQSGSMADSVVYAGVFGAVLASLPAIKTNVVVYDTAVVDLTDQLQDPVDVLFGVQLGGGNDTPLALRYCKDLLTQPEESIFVLISDLYEGSGSAEMLRRLREFRDMGVQVVVLLALDRNGKPSFDRQNASALAGMGIPVFACTPEHFPDLMAAALGRQDVSAWASARGMPVVHDEGLEG